MPPRARYTGANRIARAAAISRRIERGIWQDSNAYSALTYLMELKRNGPCKERHAPMCIYPPTVETLTREYCADCGGRLSDA